MPNANSKAVVESISGGSSTILSALIAGKRYKLPKSGKLTITYSFIGKNSEFVDDYGSGENTRSFFLNKAQKANVRRALAAWSAVANIRFNEVADNASSAGVMRFGSDSAEATAHGYLPAATAEAGDVWLGGAWSDGSTHKAGSKEFASLLRSIGRALGLKNPGKYGGKDKGPFLSASKDTLQYTVMSKNPHANGKFQTVSKVNDIVSSNVDTVYPSRPALYDISAIQRMYRSNGGYNTRNTVYRFSNSNPFLKTIWDAGGNDIIDASNFKNKVRINLNDGSFSSLTIKPKLTDGVKADPQATYDGSNNLAIAWRTFIETAKGGSSGDLLIGNERRNRLMGNGGRDRLFGNRGRDVLTGGWAADRFVYTATNQGGDTIRDFSAKQGDKVEFKRSAFGKIKKGQLKGWMFAKNWKGLAQDKNDYFTFSTKYGRLFYDRDGSGSARRVLIATFSNKASLNNNHIVIA